jgi:outer membrane protein assembly factor BamD
LGHNYPDSSWYKDSYALLGNAGLSPGASGSGWLSQVYRQVLKGQWL